MVFAKSSLKKSLGQHFLTDSTVLFELIAHINPVASDRFLEIGPGAGALTEPVLQRCSDIHAIELDRDWIEPLRQKFSSRGLQLHHADATKFDFVALFDQQRIDHVCNLNRVEDDFSKPKLWRVIGNLPYNVASLLLFRLHSVADRVLDQHFMLQKEVVDRLIAPPSTPEYGRLSVMMQARYDLDCLMVIEPHAFVPPPKVFSAVVRMIPHYRFKGVNWTLLERVVKQAFSMRRKILRTNLAEFDRICSIQQSGIDPQARAQDVSVEQYLNYVQSLDRLWGSNS